jgi:hypothetical protein
MTLQSTGTRRSRAVLDNNVVRALAYPGESPLDALRAARSCGISFHLADSAVVELVRQLSERRFDWPEWLRSRRALVGLLDPHDPILAAEVPDLASAGVRFRDDQDHFAEDEEPRRQERRTRWKAIIKARNLAELGRRRWGRVAGRMRALSLDLSSANAILQRKEDSWIAGLMSISHKRGVKVPRNEVFAFSASYIDEHMVSAPPASRRLDAYLRMNAAFGLSRLKATSPYNPVKNRNDAVDLDLLVFLALPVAVCTGDERLRRLVEGTGSWQAPWVITPTQLANAVSRAALTLDWPD